MGYLLFENVSSENQKANQFISWSNTQKIINSYSTVAMASHHTTPHHITPHHTTPTPQYHSNITHIIKSCNKSMDICMILPECSAINDTPGSGLMDDNWIILVTEFGGNTERMGTCVCDVFRSGVWS